MKTTETIKQIPRQAPGTATGIASLQSMKTGLTLIKCLVTLCCAFATTAAFGQATQIFWVGPAAATPGGANLGRSTNWLGGAEPGPSTIGVFDGTVPGNLRVFSQDGINGAGNAIGGGFGTEGFSIDMTPSQTGSLSVFSSVPASPNMGFNSVRVQSGAGQLIMGENAARLWQTVFRPSASPHYWINESANPVIVNPSLVLQGGGGNGGHSLIFQGPGSFNITNNLRSNNGPDNPIPVIWENTGTTFWAEGSPNGNGAAPNFNRFNTLIGPITISAGTLVVTTPRLFPLNNVNGNTITHEGTLLKFDLSGIGGSSDTVPRIISGAGPIEISRGTITFSGASTTTGTIALNGGQLIAGGVENVGVSGPLGVGGTISFGGGTLGFSSVNAFDYSPRFSSAAGQQYRINTAGQSVTFNSDLTSSGGTLTKTGPGKLTLAGSSSYTGNTTNASGALIFQGSKTGTGNILGENGTTLGFTATGTQVTPGTLTVGTSGSAGLQFNNVNSTATSILAPTTLSAGGPIDINVGGGTFTVGQNYPLFSWTGGSTPAVSLGYVIGGTGTLNTNGNSIRLNINALSYVWDGVTGGNWTDANNWRVGGSPVTYSNPNPALFDDTATGTTNVTVVGVVQPGNVVFNNSSKPYTVTSSSGNNIGGSASLIKVGTGTATLSGGFNSYSGVSSLFEGTLSVGALANGGVASDIGASGNGAANLVFNGGALQYTGGAASVDRLFTLGTGGGTIDASGTGALNLNNTGTIGLTGLGARVLTLTGSDTNDNTLAAVLGDSGDATAVTKNGAGKWVLAGDSVYSGVTTIANGTLQVGAGGASGSLGSGDVVNNAQLIFDRSGTLTVNNVISGTGGIAKNGSGTVILANNNTYAGTTVVNAGTLQVGNGGASGNLNSSSTLTVNGTFVFNSSGTLALGNGIAGTGNIVVRGGGLLQAIAGNTYTGWTLIEPGSTFQPFRGNTGGLLSSVVTNNGTLLFIRQEADVAGYSNNIVGTGRLGKENNNQNAGDVTLAGNNTYTGGTWIAGGGLVLGDGLNPGQGSIVGPVFFTNTVSGELNDRYLSINRPDDIVFANSITSVVTDGSPVANQGRFVQRGLGMVTLTGNNSYPGTTTINAGSTLQVGNGGTSGNIGSGGVTVEGTLVFNRSDTVTIGAVIGGAGSVVKLGSGTLLLNGVNTYTGSTTVSNGIFGGSGTLAGPVTLEAGTTLAPGASVGTLTINSDLTIGGNVAIEVDKSLAQSNDIVNVTGTLTKTGAGTLTVANLGPALQVGDKFTLFSQPLTGGASLTVTGAGATWQNDLATDGSITVLTAAPAQPTLNYTQTGNNLQFTWTGGGYKLQSQTNNLNVGINNVWGDYPGGGTSPVNVTIDPTKPTVFFRLAPVP